MICYQPKPSAILLVQCTIHMILYEVKYNIVFVICILYVFQNKHTNNIHCLLILNYISFILTTIFDKKDMAPLDE